VKRERLWEVGGKCERVDLRGQPCGNKRATVSEEGEGEFLNGGKVGAGLPRGLAGSKEVAATNRELTIKGVRGRRP